VDFAKESITFALVCSATIPFLVKSMKKIVTNNAHAMMMILKINVAKINAKEHVARVIVFLVVN
jgi:hypothetical protein